MKSFLTLLVVVVLCLGMLGGCAPSTNQARGTVDGHGAVAGFWLGMWHGFIAPFVFVISLFKSNLNIYEVHNDGGWYNFGYLCGMACFLRGGHGRTVRRKQVLHPSSRDGGA